ncbi:hypothetical protein, partial [Streptomyces sp. LS1784]
MTDTGNGAPEATDGAQLTPEEKAAKFAELAQRVRSMGGQGPERGASAPREPVRQPSGPEAPVADATGGGGPAAPAA